MYTESNSSFVVISESSQNLINGRELSECLQSAVYNVKGNGASTLPCEAPVLSHTTADLVHFKETKWGRFVR